MSPERTPKNRPHLKARKGPSAARPRRLVRQVQNPQVAQAVLVHLQVLQLVVPQPQYTQLPNTQPQVSQLQVTQLPVTPPEVAPLPTPYLPSPIIAISVPRLGEKRSSTDASLRSMALEAKRHKNCGIRRAPHAKIMAAHTKAEVQRLQRSIRLLQGHYHIPSRPYARSKEVKAARRFMRKVGERRPRHRDIEFLESYDGSVRSSPPEHQLIVLDDSEEMIYATDPTSLEVVAAIPKSWGYRAMWKHLASIRRLDLAAHMGCPDSEISKDVDIVMDSFDGKVSVPVQGAIVLETSPGSVIQSASSNQATTPKTGVPFREESMEWGPSNKVPQVKVPAAAVVAKEATPLIADPVAGPSSSKARPVVVPSVVKLGRKEKVLPRRTQREATTNHPGAATVATVGLPPLSLPQAAAAEPMTEDEFQAALEAWAASSSAPGLPQAPVSQELPVPTPFLPPAQETASAPSMGTQHPQGLPSVATTATGTGSALPSTSGASPVPVSVQYPEVPGRKVRRLRQSRAMLDSTTPTPAPPPAASTSTSPSASTERIDRKGKGKEKAAQAQVDTPQPRTVGSGLGVSRQRSAAQTEGASGSGSSGPSAAGGSATSATGRIDRKGKGKEKVPEYLKTLAAWGLDGDDDEEDEARDSHTFRAATRAAKGAGGLIRSRR